MAIVRWKDRGAYNPWADLQSLQDEINDLFNADRFPATAGLFDRKVSPAMNVAENEDGFTVVCELPGIDDKDIDLTIASNVLTIKGEKKSQRNEKNGRCFRKESWEGSFQRTVSLPSTVDPDGIEANITDGLLTVSIPKKEEAKPKQISVKIN